MVYILNPASPPFKAPWPHLEFGTWDYKANLFYEKENYYFLIVGREDDVFLSFYKYTVDPWSFERLPSLMTNAN